MSIIYHAETENASFFRCKVEIGGVKRYIMDERGRQSPACGNGRTGVEEYGSYLAFCGILLLAGVCSNKLASRFNMPVLLMFLAAGMAVGVYGSSHFTLKAQMHGTVINSLGAVAMYFILFSGGLGTKYKAIRPVLGRGLVLATAGVLLTALFLGAGGYVIYLLFARGESFSLTFSWWLLLASLISSTDAAATFAILRGNGVNLSGGLQPLLELESGSNDPMAALLTIAMIQLITGKESFSLVQIPAVAYKIVVGAGVGLLVGWAGTWFFSRHYGYEGLYYVLGVALVLICAGVAECIRSNGFLSVYVCGVVMGNNRYNYRSGLERFNEGVAWLMQVILFTSLGALIRPRDLLTVQVLVPGILMSLTLMFLARPAAVFSCLAGSDFSLRERLLISWAGLRGAAPIVLATFPLAAGVDHSSYMFNMIFFMVIGSILVQGRSLMPLARKLGLTRPFVARSRAPLELETISGVNYRLHEFEVTPACVLAGVTLAEAKFPPGVLVTLIRRGGGFIPAGGSTRIENGDGLLVIGMPEKLRILVENFFPDSDYSEDDELQIFKKRSERK